VPNSSSARSVGIRGAIARHHPRDDAFHDDAVGFDAHTREIRRQRIVAAKLEVTFFQKNRS